MCNLLSTERIVWNLLLLPFSDITTEPTKLIMEPNFNKIEILRKETSIKNIRALKEESFSPINLVILLKIYFIPAKLKVIESNNAIKKLLSHLGIFLLICSSKLKW
jgi:hypothetical protein